MTPAAIAALCLGKDQSVTLAGDGRSEISSIEEVDAADWIYRSQGVTLAAQTLYQQGGYSTTLLQVLDSDGSEGLDDAYDRFTVDGSDRKR